MLFVLKTKKKILGINNPGLNLQSHAIYFLLMVDKMQVDRDQGLLLNDM